MRLPIADFMWLETVVSKTKPHTLQEIVEKRNRGGIYHVQHLFSPLFLAFGTAVRKNVYFAIVIPVLW